MSESKINIPKFSYPFKKVQSQEKYYDLLEKETHGNYLFSKDGFWHGGIHFNDSLTELSATEGIRAIADGQIVAFRINDEYLQNDDEEKNNEGLYSNGFFLLKHYFEYPVGNKLTFFSLYMHTAKKDKYDFSTHSVIGESRYLRKGISYKDEDKLEELEKDTKITIGKEVGKNRYKVLYVKDTKREDEATIHISNIKKIENRLEYKCINRETKIDEIIIPSEPIKVKAGEVLGLVGEYNITQQKNRELLHLEIFTDNDVKSFASNAKDHYEKDTSKDKPKPTKIKIQSGKIIYEIKEQSVVESSDGTATIKDSNNVAVSTQAPLNNGTKIEVDTSTIVLNNRYKLLKIDTNDVSTNNWNIYKGSIGNIQVAQSTDTTQSKDITLNMSEIKTITLDNKKYVYINKEQTKGILYSDCKEYHPISFDWATIIDESSSDDISIFSNIDKYLLPEQEELKEKKLEINTLYKELFKIIDNDSNGQIDAQELEEAAKDKTIKKLTSKYIVKHSTEWDKKVNLPNSIKTILEKYKDNISNYDRIMQHLDNEEKRVEKLAFFEECKSVSDFPKIDKVFHINPIGLVGEFYQECTCLSMDKFQQIFPNASKDKREKTLEVFNKYCQIFEINSPLRVAHFFAQVKEEVGENINYQIENLNYSINALKYGDFKYFRNNHQEAELYGRGNGHPANERAIANRAYGNRIDLGNGDIASGDGWNFRGKGFIQLTGRTNYENANNEIQSKIPNSAIDIIANPESILTIEGAMVSTMAYWTMNNLNKKADKAGWNRENVDDITDVVNSATSSREDRKNNFDLIQNILNN